MPSDHARTPNSPDPASPHGSHVLRLFPRGGNCHELNPFQPNVLVTPLIGPDHIPTFPRLPAHSRAPPRIPAPSAPHTSRPSCGIPARASPEPREPNRHPHDSIPGLRTRVRAPPLAPSRAKHSNCTEPFTWSPRARRMVSRVPRTVPRHNKLLSLSARLSLEPITTSPVPASRPDTTRLIPVSGSGSRYPSVLVSGLNPSRTTRGNFPFTGP